MPNPVIDVFLSYASVDVAHADRLADALERADVSVWRDTQRIETFDAIQPVIAEGLSRSKVLLALYSINYTKRRACDWELASAYVASGAERVLVVNPEASTDHIQPQTLRERRLAVLTSDTDLDALAQTIKAAVDKLDAPLGALPKPADDQAWIGLSRHGGAHRFVGRRAEIWQVHDGLAAGSVLLAPTTSGSAPGDGTAMLRGLGGVGKSLLAEEYARRFAAAWPGGIFWLRAGGGKSNDASGQLFGQRQMLANKLGIPQQPNTDALERALAQAMAARPGPYLWVVDDLPYGMSSGQVRQWLAPSGQGRTLITTRDRGVDGIARLVDLAELTQEEALRLLALNRRPSGPDEEAAAKEIVELIGCHALAVDLARHLVERYGWAKLLTDLRDPDKEALELAAQMRFELPNGHEKSIAETLLQSIHLLSPPALDALRLASILASHEPIPESLLAAVVALSDGTEVANIDLDPTTLAIDQVHSHSLCEATDGQYAVHALVCRTVALRHADVRSCAIHEAAIEILQQWMSVATDIRRHDKIISLIPHAIAIAAKPKTEMEADLIGKVGRYFFEAGILAAAYDAFSSAHTALRLLLGSEHPNTLVAQGNMASTLRAQGNLPKALELQQEVYELRYRSLGPSHPDTLTSMANLAAILVDQGDIARALHLQQEELAVSVKVLGREHPDALNSMNNFAETLRMRGDIAKAQRLHEEVFELRRRVLGAEHPATLTSMSNLALTLQETNKLVQARRIQQEVLEIRQRILGSKHPDTLTSMNNLGVTLQALGEYAQARQLQEEEIAISRIVLGPDHPSTCQAAVMLANTMVLLGDWETARTLVDVALAKLAATLGADHPIVQMTVEFRDFLKAQ